MWVFEMCFFVFVSIRNIARKIEWRISVSFNNQRILMGEWWMSGIRYKMKEGIKPKSLICNLYKLQAHTKIIIEFWFFVYSFALCGCCLSSAQSGSGCYVPFWINCCRLSCFFSCVCCWQFLSFPSWSEKCKKPNTEYRTGAFSS